MLEKLNKLDEQKKQLYQQNTVYIKKNLDGVDQSSQQNRRRNAGQTGFKIMEKMNLMMQRFIIYLFQSKAVAAWYCQAMRRGQDSEFIAQLNLLKSVRDKVFQMMTLRNMMFNMDIFSSSEEAMGPIKWMYTKTLEPILNNWGNF